MITPARGPLSSALTTDHERELGCPEYVCPELHDAGVQKLHRALPGTPRVPWLGSTTLRERGPLPKESTVTSWTPGGLSSVRQRSRRRQARVKAGVQIGSPLVPIHTPHGLKIRLSEDGLERVLGENRERFRLSEALFDVERWGQLRVGASNARSNFRCPFDAFCQVDTRLRWSLGSWVI